MAYVNRLMRRWPAVLVVALLLAALAMFTVPSAALAGNPIVWNHTGGRIPGYCAPNQNYSNICAWLPNSSQVYMICWLDNTWYYGNYWSNRWFWVQSFVTGGLVYVPASYVYYQTRVSAC